MKLIPNHIPNFFKTEPNWVHIQFIFWFLIFFAGPICVVYIYIWTRFCLFVCVCVTFIFDIFCSCCIHREHVRERWVLCLSLTLFLWVEWQKIFDSLAINLNNHTTWSAATPNELQSRSLKDQILWKKNKR